MIHFPHKHFSTLPSGARSIGQVQHFWVEPERSFWRRKSLFLLQLKWEVRSTSTSTYIANAMLKNNIVGRINNYPGPFKYFWSFQFFLGPAINFQTSVGQSSQISTAVFYQNSSWSFWHTDAHTKQCFLCSFFFFRFLVIAIGNWGRCYWWYVFVRTCASRSTQHAEIIQHMLENLALIALHKLCNTCSKKRHNIKGENGREGKSETASQGWLKKGNNKKIRYKTMWKRNKEGWNWKGCLRRNCVAVWPNLAEPSWVSRSQIYLLTALIIGCPHLHHQYHCHDHEHH